MNNLTKQQASVASSQEKYLLVSSVAGSGKTTTMIQRIINLLNAGVQSDRILVMMFGANARQDFENRLKKRTSEKGLRHPEVRTFHSFGKRLCEILEGKGFLRKAELITDHGKLTQRARDALSGLNESLPEERKIDLYGESVPEFMDFVDLGKGVLYGLPINNDRTTHPALADVSGDFLDAFSLYEKRREESPFRAFSDLIYDPVVAILSDPKVAAFVKDRYDHIIIDEYQDINLSQQQLLKHIAGTRASVCAVGDDDQAIFEWRGASPEFMVSEFQKEFPGAKRIHLNHTFRYGHQVSLLANHVITNNTNRADKICLSGGRQSTQISILMAGDVAGGKSIADEVIQWKSNGRALGEVAVLVREYDHTITTETAFLKYGIPYRIVGAPPFFDRVEIKTIRGAMQLAAGGLNLLKPEEISSMVDAMLSLPSLFLPRQAKDSLTQKIADAPGDFFMVLEDFSKTFKFSSAFARHKFEDGLRNWKALAGMGRDAPAAQFVVEFIRKQSLFESIEKANPRKDVAYEKQRMIKEFLEYTKRESMTIRQLGDTFHDLSEEYRTMSQKGDSVLITSAHRSKGLEWPFVIVPELAEGKFPSAMAVEPDADASLLEAERRLFYVAITRCQERLVLLAPIDAELQKRAAQRKPGFKEGGVASRFLYEANIIESTVIGEEIASGGMCAPSGGGRGAGPLSTKYIRLLASASA